MEIYFLITISLMMLVLIVLVIIFRSKPTNEAAYLQNKLGELQSNFKEDFKLNREENIFLAKENRSELNDSLKDIKTELSDTLKVITEQSHNSLREINKTLAEKVDSLILKIDENNKFNRESMSTHLKEFSLELRGKFDEQRQEQKDNAAVTKANQTEVNNIQKDFKKELAETLENIIEHSQKSLSEINKTLAEKIDLLNTKVENNNKVNREDLTKNLKDFSFDQRTKFEELKQEQKELTNKTAEQLEKITNKVELKLSNLNDQSKADNKLIRDELSTSFKGFQESIETKQNDLVKNTESKLDSIRAAVEEKLEKTLSERLGQSFDTVGKQLIEVQKGLGEMQNMAADVGGLKKVLSNVKLRGGVGEVQLAMLLEQTLAPNQYLANVITIEGSNERVEFAIKLPGRNEDESSFVYLPIDAKFPKETYEHLITAYENAVPEDIESASKNLETIIRKMAKDIRDKYIGPNTTDFAIMFLPFESIYAEVIRRSALVDQLRYEYNIAVAGPTNLMALLNSLQMGFRAMALQKRSGEVWKVLAKVKSEFEKFGGMLEKAQKNIQKGLGHLENVSGPKMRAIKSTLNNLELLPTSDPSQEPKEEHNKTPELEFPID